MLIFKKPLTITSLGLKLGFSTNPNKSKTVDQKPQVKNDICR